ncbi:polysaccharide biosynthesis/export family protein [Azospirillum sp. SYSU D00513]|uniref:polysaccharide biosynthesis/export family protein n=1 Tax=Azospirillum sp. SYSU D00513 TaxID=2812561 RepID=UPI001FFF5FEB|nr:polysaccharide biosynthesis/export family protein [Azospirillum sp. SYSU D00513]
MRIFNDRFKMSALFVVSVLLAGCSGTVGEFPSAVAPTKAVDAAEGYRLEPGNRVRVVVFNEQNLSGDFMVDPVGNVAMPLIGNVSASGVTSKELAARIAGLLQRDAYLQDPKVAVEIQTFRPFYVLGEVRQPGEFPYTNGMTVLSAVARAGGYDYRAREGQAVLVRLENGEQKEYAAAERTPILPGDIIRVLQRRF